MQAAVRLHFSGACRRANWAGKAFNGENFHAHGAVRTLIGVSRSSADDWLQSAMSEHNATREAVPTAHEVLAERFSHCD